MIKIQFVDKKLHEIKNEILRDYVGDFERVGSLKVDVKFDRHILDLEILMILNLIATLLMKDVMQEMLFSKVFLKLITPQFNKVSRSQYRNGCDFKHETIEYRGNNYLIPTKVYCFIKCINFLTGGDYKEQYLNFIRNEKRRSNIMNKARIQPICRANNINLGYYDGETVFP